MDINDIKNAINSYCKEKLGDFDTVREKHYCDNDVFAKTNKKLVATLNIREHHDYTLGTNIYEFREDSFWNEGRLIGYLAIEEVIDLRYLDQEMTDCGEEVVAYNVKGDTKSNFEIIYDK